MDGMHVRVRMVYACMQYYACMRACIYMYVCVYAGMYVRMPISQ